MKCRSIIVDFFLWALVSFEYFSTFSFSILDKDIVIDIVLGMWQAFWNELYSRFWGPQRIAHYLSKIIVILIIVFIGIVVYKTVSWFLSRLLKKHQEPRAMTIIPLTNSILKYLTFFIILIAVLRELGVNYGAILAGAGVVGLAVGFGAQTLIRDIISGFFILFENLISVGDVIEIGSESGTVERIGLRTTQFRDYSGVLRTIPNGELTRFGNYNRDFMRALVIVNLDYDTDISRGMTIAEKVAKDWAKNNPEIVLEEPVVQGILDFSPAGATIRIVTKVKPQTQWDAERDIRRLLKLAFDEHGIKIPAERKTVFLQKI